MTYYLSIAALVLDENSYLPEWMAYHRLVGVERENQSHPSGRIRFALNVTEAGKATRRFECLVKEGKVRVE